FLLRWTVESFLLTELVFLILNGFLLFRKGQTIGKLAMGTKIVGLEGNIPDFGRIYMLRYFLIRLVRQIPILGGLFGLVDALVIFGKDRRCLHDYIAGTRVIVA
ncbi:MAG TPA: RDD family protein, partial [Verrucomicrobiaceae bacterium]